MFSNLFFRKSCRLWNNVQKYGEARGAADDNMAARCMLHKTTRAQDHTQSNARASSRMHVPTHVNNILVNPPQCYVIPTLPVLFFFPENHVKRINTTSEKMHEEKKCLKISGGKPRRKKFGRTCGR
jgi:hypothetical protein